MCPMGKKLGPVIELTLGLCLRNLNLFPDFASLLSSHNYTDLLGGGVMQEGSVVRQQQRGGYSGRDSGYPSPDSGCLGNRIHPSSCSVAVTTQGQVEPTEGPLCSDVLRDRWSPKLAHLPSCSLQRLAPRGPGEHPAVH